MELQQFNYDNRIVKAFIIATVVFGLIGMLVGLTAAIQLFYPVFNFKHRRNRSPVIADGAVAG